MKARIVLLFLLFIAGFQSLSGQIVTAGLITGQNVVYIDPNDIQLICNNLYTNTSYSLDINQDGINDMTFNASYYYYSHLELQGTQTSVDPNSVTQISKLDSLEYGILKHEFGDTINEKLNWNQAGMAIFNSYSSNGTTEYFTNEGFVGFRICNTDTIYGWIHASASGDYSSAQLNIYDYAYVAKPNQVVVQDQFQNISCSNHVNDDLLIKIQGEDFCKTYKCTVYDISARLLMEKQLTTGENHMNISTFQSGVYLVIIHEKSGIEKGFKIIKR